MSVQLWPFPPLLEVIEACSWLTDVLRTRESEQRQNLRAIPRREVTYQHNVNQADVALARKLARNATSWRVPDWTQLVRQDVAEGAATILPDGLAAIWRGVRDLEQITVSGGLLVGVSAPATDVRVIPVYPARMLGMFENSRPAGDWSQISATFELQDLGDVSAATLYPQYLGHDLITDCPQVSNTTFTEALDWQRETADNGVAAPVDTRTLAYADATFMVRWWSRSPAAVRAWIYSRRGKWRSFWLPSWAHDMRKLSGSGASLTVDDYDTAEGHIAALIGGTLYPRAVSSAALTSSDTWSLTLSSALPGGTVERLMYLRHVRFNADRIEFNHRAGSGGSVAVPCIEVPA